MSGPKPVYRYPPRSHAYNCPCPRCVQCRGTRSPGSDLISFDLGCLAVVLGFAAISALIGWLSRLPAQAWLTAGAVTGILVITGIMFRVVSTRRVRPAKGRLHVEATPQTMPPSPPSICVPAVPVCLHVSAVRIGSTMDPALTLENWCPDCEASLGAGFKWACCGGAPGDRPGAGHVYNCPQAAKP